MSRSAMPLSLIAASTAVISLGIGVARRARGLALAGDADADHGGVGRGGDRCLAGDRHQFVELIGGLRR